MKLRIAVLLLLVLLRGPAAANAAVTVSASGGHSHRTWHGQADVQALNIEIGRDLSPRTEVAFVLSPMSFWQPRSWFGAEFGDGNETVHAVAGSLLVRRKFNTDSARVQFYGEASMGPMWAEKAIPASTSRFNFATNLGAGVMLMPRSRFPVMVGYRFMHLSNGGYAPRNPGFNISAVVVGVRVRR
jgi:hypothetical protein